MLEANKYSSVFISWLLRVFLKYKQWYSDLKILLKEIADSEQNQLESHHLFSLTVDKNSELLSYFISLVEFFPWNQSFEDQKVTALSLFLKDTNLLFYLKLFHSLIPQHISRQLKEKARKEIFDFSNIGKFQFPQLFLMSLFYFNPDEVKISNLFLQLCCLQLCYDFQEK